MQRKKKNIIFISISIIFIIYVIGMSIIRIKFIENIIPTPVAYYNKEWGVNLPEPYRREKIYAFEFKDEPELKIWYYDEGKIKEIINDNNLKKIDEQNKEFILNKIDEHYSPLEEEKKQLFKCNVPHKNSLMSEENYYYFKKNDNDASWLLLILENETGKVYFIHTYY